MGPPRQFVILDEDQIIADTAARILRSGGYTAMGMVSIEETARVLTTAGPFPAVVLLSSVIAARGGAALALVLGIEPRPTVLLTCTCSGTCPLFPAVSCAAMGCLLKPEDFMAGTLLRKMDALLARNQGSPHNAILPVDQISSTCVRRLPGARIAAS